MNQNQKLFNAIESPEFAAMASLASGLHSFERVVRTQEPFRTAEGLVHLPGAEQKVFRRLTEIAKRSIEKDYENPFDTALAAYLLLLDSVDSPHLATALRIVKVAPNCFWAPRVADRITQTRSVGTVTTLFDGNALLALAYSQTTEISGSVEFDLKPLSLLPHTPPPEEFEFDLVDENGCWQSTARYANRQSDTREEEVLA